MLNSHVKGERRTRLDNLRLAHGEPQRNAEKNRTAHSHFPKGAKASRKKGRNRFRTGKKSSSIGGK